MLTLFKVSLRQSMIVDESQRHAHRWLGRWINGGGWLTIGGTRVDLLYRDLMRVGEIINDCRDGSIEREYQPGHPHAFVSTIYMGEVVYCRLLWDPAGRLTELKKLTVPYPRALRDRHGQHVPVGSRICDRQWPPWPRVRGPRLRRRLRLPIHCLFVSGPLCNQWWVLAERKERRCHRGSPSTPAEHFQVQGDTRTWSDRLFPNGRGAEHTRAPADGDARNHVTARGNRDDPHL